MRHIAAIRMISLVVAVAPAAAAGQSALEQTTGLPHLWTGVPWSLEMTTGSLLGRSTHGATTGLAADPSVRAALALPGRLVAEVRYAPQPTEIGGRDEVEGSLRASALGADRGHAFDLGFEGRVSTGSELTAASAMAGRWLGPVRLAAMAGAIAGDERVRPVLGAGALWHPAPGRLPIAVAADAVAPLRLDDGESVAWTAGIQLGVSFTPHTVSVFATNGGTSLVGRMAGTDQVRLGIGLTGHVPVGRFLGRYVEREVSRGAVLEEVDAEPVVVVAIREYRYAPTRIEIDAGTAVEWINDDRMVHTASADNGTWGSGGLQQGESWRAVFTTPGIYPYHCGPHPYMRGVVVVR
jgi:plastocyanin